jgi:CHCH domain
MPHGTCGLEFREAFSCFVKSEADPKGEDCIDAFKSMQDCFRYPTPRTVDTNSVAERTPKNTDP